MTAPQHPRDGLGCARAFLVSLPICLLFWVLIAWLLWLSDADAQALDFGRISGDAQMVELRDCQGGGIDTAVMLFDALEATGARVKLSGTVASACTMAIDWSNVCWDRSATFLFHRGTHPGGNHHQATWAMVQRLPRAVIAELPPWTDWTETYTPRRAITGARMSELTERRLCG